MMHAENGPVIDVIAADLVAAGHHRPDRARPGPLRRSSRARRRTGSSAWPRPPASPSTSSTSRPATPSRRSRRPATAARWPSPRPARSTSSSRSTTSGNGFEGAKFVCSPPLRPTDHQEDLWRGLRTDDLQLVGDRPLPVRLPRPEGAGPGRLPQDPERAAGRRGPGRPAPRRRRRRRPDLAASAGSRSCRPRRPRCSGCTRRRARSRSAPTPTSSSTTRPRRTRSAPGKIQPLALEQGSGGGVEPGPGEFCRCLLKPSRCRSRSQSAGSLAVQTLAQPST